MPDNGYTAIAAAVVKGDSPCACGSGYARGYCRTCNTPDEREQWLSDRFGLTRRPALHLLTSAEFADADYRLEWLVKRLLVKDQPCVIGGPRKALKTSLVIDLALSLGGARQFLGEFWVADRTRTLIMSGESGEAVLQETARRVCAAKKLELRDCDVLWGFRLPQLAALEDLAAVNTAIKQRKIQVAIFDPLYLALLGDGKLDTANLFEMGALLRRVAEACLDAGATPILVHHFRKNVADPWQPAAMEELAYAGIQEFARQWLLVNRRENFEPGTGSHRLWLSAGGSSGHGGLWAVDAEEGQLDDMFGGRRWEVKVQTGTDAQKSAAELVEQAKQADQDQKDRADEAKLLTVLDTLDPDRQGVSFDALQAEAHWGKTRAERTVGRLKRQGAVEEFDRRYLSGNRTERFGRGFRRPVSNGSYGSSTALPDGGKSRCSYGSLLPPPIGGGEP